jgi:ABC-type uncharacterized transport system fused permease/ATPase subunit
MTLGTLRDQVIYPHTPAQAKKLRMGDDELEKLLDLVINKLIKYNK